MAKFEHIRHRPPTVLNAPRTLAVALAPLRSNVNLSRIVRLCGCAGITQLIQCGPGKVDPEIARDATDVVKISQKNSLPPILKEWKANGYSCVGLEQTTNSHCLYDFTFPEKTLLVIGSERAGLTDDILAELDYVVEIPVYGKPFSYNVATATTMAVYEYCRQFPS